MDPDDVQNPTDSTNLLDTIHFGPKAELVKLCFLWSPKLEKWSRPWGVSCNFAESTTGHQLPELSRTMTSLVCLRGERGRAQLYRASGSHCLLIGLREPVQRLGVSERLGHDSGVRGAPQQQPQRRPDDARQQDVRHQTRRLRSSGQLKHNTGSTDTGEKFFKQRQGLSENRLNSSLR